MNRPHHLNFSKYVCSHLWSHVVIDFAKAQFRNCCKTAPIAATADDMDGDSFFANSTPVLGARKQMLTNMRPSMCGVCWRLEDFGLPSHRSSVADWTGHMNAQYRSKMSENELLGIEIDKLAHSTAPTNLDIQLDSACDLKCIYCNEEYSTQWEKEKKQFGSMPHESNAKAFQCIDQNLKDRFEKQFWNWFSEHKGGLRRIAFLGGEPLYSPRFFSTFEKLSSEYSSVPKNLEINIISNLNAKEQIFEKFIALIIKNQDRFIFNINISMEAWGEKAEFIRHGVNYERFQKNFERLMVSTNRERVHISTITSINLFAISSLHLYLAWLLQIQIQNQRPVILYHNLVSYPSWLGLDMAPKSFVSYIQAARVIVQGGLREHGNLLDLSWSRYLEFLENIENRISKNAAPTSEQSALFTAAVVELKKRRGLDFEKLFPELLSCANP